MGYLNSRLRSRQTGEENIMGQWILGTQEQYFNQTQETRENRDRLTEFCNTWDLFIQNTKFPKPASQKCTYREMGTARGPPWSPEALPHALSAVMGGGIPTRYT